MTTLYWHHRADKLKLCDNGTYTPVTVINDGSIDLPWVVKDQDKWIGNAQERSRAKELGEEYYAEQLEIQARKAAANNKEQQL